MYYKLEESLPHCIGQGLRPSLGWSFPCELFQGDKCLLTSHWRSLRVKTFTIMKTVQSNIYNQYVVMPHQYIYYLKVILLCCQS